MTLSSRHRQEPSSPRGQLQKGGNHVTYHQQDVQHMKAVAYHPSAALEAGDLFSPALPVPGNL